jgi:hypothetical protein
MPMTSQRLHSAVPFERIGGGLSAAHYPSHAHDQQAGANPDLGPNLANLPDFSARQADFRRQI